MFACMDLAPFWTGNSMGLIIPPWLSVARSWACMRSSDSLEKEPGIELFAQVSWSNST